MKRITPETDCPPPGSVVLAYGPAGTAYQRHADGLFHSTAGSVVGFDYFLLRARNTRDAGDFILYVPALAGASS